MDTDDRLRLAFAGLHPEQTRALLSDHRPAIAVRSVAGRRASSAAAATAVDVPAAIRRDELTQLGVTPIWRGGPGFPSCLGDRPDSPDVLFLRGTIPPLPGVAVVGTRRCTSYGRQLARSYGRAIARAGWPLISGLARGIDGAAHQGTVDAGGLGVAVLGCGIDVAYPKEHAPLADQLLELGGAVVTEYPPGTRPEGWRFPPRNRIISGMSAAVVVVEAATKGGALITASAALEQGIPVFAVPGDVTRESSRGCNLLIRDGAHPVLDPSDLVAELELILGPAEGPATCPDFPPRLLELLGRTGAETTIDEIAAATGLAAGDVLGLVSALEAEGVVSTEGGMVIAL